MTEVEGYETQVIMIDTIMGPQPRFAPAGWTFDKTAKVAWTRAMFIASDIHRMETGLRKYRRKDLAEANAALYTLCEVLASSLGMAGPYWQQAAKAFFSQQLTK